ENLACKNHLATINPKSHAISNKCLPKRGSKLRSEIAHLIRMTQNEESRIELLDRLLQRGNVTIGRVLGQFVVLDGMNAFEFLPGDLRGNAPDGLSHQHRRQFLASRRCDSLGRDHRLERGLIQHSVSLLYEK